jgi:cell division septation protein DedD
LEDRLKERLTGAILLVVLVVVLVPSIFRGEPSGAAAVTSAASAQQQVYTIDLKGATAPPAAAENIGADSAGATGSANEPPASIVADAPPAGDAAPAASSGSRDASEAVSVAASAAAAMPPDKPAIIAKATPVAKPQPASKVPAAAKPTPVATTKGTFVVQVGSFNKRDNAQQMVKQAARKGVRLVVAGPDDRGNFRVRTAAVHTRQDAVVLQERLKGQGFKGLIGAVN